VRRRKRTSILHEKKICSVRLNYNFCNSARCNLRRNPLMSYFVLSVLSFNLSSLRGSGLGFSLNKSSQLRNSKNDPQTGFTIYVHYGGIIFFPNQSIYCILFKSNKNGYFEPSVLIIVSPDFWGASK
jgi:hypothetical protein